MVDPWGVTHDVRNLAIIDGSVFVTVGAANPTSTISALVLRAVDHLLAHRADVPSPNRRALRVTAGIGACPGGWRRHRSCSPTAVGDAARRLGVRSPARPSSRPTTACPPPPTSGSPTTLLDAVLDARPDLLDDLLRALDRDVDDPLALGSRCCARPTHRRTARWSCSSWPPTTVRPTSGRASGYPGQEATPVGRFEFPEYLSEGLLDHLVAW